MSTNAIEIQIVNTPAEAPHYARDTCDVRSLSLDKVIIVRAGTEGGLPTCDFQLTDADGNKFVAMLTGRIVSQLGFFVQQATLPPLEG